MKDEAVLFTAAISGARLCLRCASIKADIVEDCLVGVIQRVQRMICVTENVEECDGCRRRTVVYQLR
jgi:hypothetical protein